MPADLHRPRQPAALAADHLCRLAGLLVRRQLRPEAPARRGVTTETPMPGPDEHAHHDHHHGSELSDVQLRVRALETILTEKGYVDPAALDQIVETAETRIGPHVGARIVAHAWT